MKSNLTVTIGIPAYNEAANIVALLNQLLSQRHVGWSLTEILVYSDSSTDGTNQLVHRLGSPRVRLLAGRVRRGVAHAEQQLINRASSDILLLLNADVTISQNDFITQMVKPFRRDRRVGLVAAQVTPTPGHTFLARVLDHSHRFKTALYTSLGTANIYLCHGRALALSQIFYSQLSLPPVIADDAYLHLRSRELGFTFDYQPRARVYYYSPSTLADHFLQSRRFFRGRRELSVYFSKQTLAESYAIPPVRAISAWTLSLLHHPLYTLTYLGVLCWSLLSPSSKVTTGVVWHPSTSSKPNTSRVPHLDVVTQYFYPVTAGIETNILETYSELVKLGWSVTVHSSRDTLTEKNSLSPTASVRGLQVRRYHSGPIGFFPKLSHDPGNLICLHNFNLFPHFWIYLRAAIHALTGQKHYGIFLTPHGGFTPEWPTFPLLPRLVKRLYHAFPGRFFANYLSDGIRAISVWEQQALTQVGIKSSQIILIPNGLDTVARRPLRLISAQVRQIVRRHSPYLLSIGRLAPIKNYETTIKALAATPGPLKLLIVGPSQDQAYVDSLYSLAKRLRVAQRLVFLGVVRGEDKYYLIKHSLAFVHLARWESFCNVVYEAQSLGQLCIVADNTALHSLVRHDVTGLLTPTFDHRQLSVLLTQLQAGECRPQIARIKRSLRAASFPTWGATANLMQHHYQLIAESYAHTS